MTRLIHNRSMTARQPFDGAAPHPNRKRILVEMQDGTAYLPPCRFPCLRWDIVEEWAEEHVEIEHRREFYAKYGEDDDV